MNIMASQILSELLNLTTYFDVLYLSNVVGRGFIVKRKSLLTLYIETIINEEKKKEKKMY